LERPHLARLPAQARQDALAQDIRVAFAGFRKLDNAAGDPFVGAVIAVRDPKGDASHLECETHDAPGLGIERFPV
jgi:hypothetical protein